MASQAVRNWEAAGWLTFALSEALCKDGASDWNESMSNEIAGVPFIPRSCPPPRAGYGRREGARMASYDSAVPPGPRCLTVAFKVPGWLHAWPDIGVRVLYRNPSGTRKGGGETILRQRGQTLGNLAA